MECVNLDNGTQGDDGQGTPCSGAQVGTGGNFTVYGTQSGPDTTNSSVDGGLDWGVTFYATGYGAAAGSSGGTGTAPPPGTGGGPDTRKLACSADVAINFGLGFIPGYNALKLGAAFGGVSFNPVEGYLGYKSAVTLGPTPIGAAAGAASAYSLYRWSIFDAAGGASAFNRLTDLAGRASFASKSASQQAQLLGKIGNLSSLSRVASAAGTAANLLNVASAAADLYSCLQP
jgi:hypothetical protein